uniref:Uncharacterized protein n=1 Tax=Nelumbo nucifera TaxID=4432 RepID=A0A822YXY6_NELNU|nr:TPA_asm: hypothetical protein HUJ06_007012 [Nelumbo nucifera]
MDVRRLEKEDTEARATLAMLGAIPPLVGMLDSSDLDFQIASLYALLNLGTGNDTYDSLCFSSQQIRFSVTNLRFFQNFIDQVCLISFYFFQDLSLLRLF